MIKTIKSLRATSSKIAKETILKNNKDDVILKKVLLATYDKINLNYYVKKYDEPLECGTLNIESDAAWAQIDANLMKLSKREVTGHAAIDLVETMLGFFDLDSQDIIECILDRDLKIGCSENTINKAIPKLVPVFDVALAKSYDEKTEKKVSYDGSWYASRKLDGCRCIAIKNDGNWKFMSRKGKEFLTLDNLISDLDFLTKDYDNIVFDGEICIVDDNGDEDFSAIMKQIKKKDHSIGHPMYKIFDVLTPEEFFSQKSDRILCCRTEQLSKLFEAPLSTVSQLEQIPLTEESFADLQKEVSDNGWEGLILRKNTPYKGKRSDELLKVKKFYDAEYVVEDVEFDELTFTEKGVGQETITCLKSVLINHKGQTVNVGSGFTKDQRIKFYEDSSNIIGKTITVQYFEETTNKKGTISLRFPTVKHIFEGTRDV